MKNIMNFRGFFARVSVVLAIVLAQSVAQDSQDLGANQRQDSNKISRESNTDSSNYAFAPPPFKQKDFG